MKSPLLCSAACALGALAGLAGSVRVSTICLAAERRAAQSAGVCRDENSILILAKKGKDNQQARKIKEQLAGQGCNVELDPPDHPSETIEETVLKYFYHDDQKIAGEIVRFLRSHENLQVKLVDMVSWCEKQKCDAKPRHFEMWLADPKAN